MWSRVHFLVMAANSVVLFLVFYSRRVKFETLAKELKIYILVTCSREKCCALFIVVVM